MKISILNMARQTNPASRLVSKTACLQNAALNITTDSMVWFSDVTMGWCGTINGL